MEGCFFKHFALSQPLVTSLMSDRDSKKDEPKETMISNEYSLPRYSILLKHEMPKQDRVDEYELGGHNETNSIEDALEASLCVSKVESQKGRMEGTQSPLFDDLVDLWDG